MLLQAIPCHHDSVAASSTESAKALRCWRGGGALPCVPPPQYPIQKITEIYNKFTEMYKNVTELEISSWNVLSLLRSEVVYIGTGHILP